MADITSAYQQGLQALIERLGEGHPRYVEAVALQTCLRRNADETQTYGETDALRAEWSRIAESLNRLALETTR